MVVAIDATPLSVSSGGVRRYTEQLARALGERFPGDTYHLVSDQPFEAPCMPSNVFVHPNSAATTIDRRWWTIGLPRTLSRLRCSLFHGTDFSVPYLPLRPSVLTLQDLSPWMDPSWHHAAGRVRTRTPALIRLGIATMVITPTEAIRKQAIAHFGIHPNRVAAVPDAAARHLAPVSSNTPASQYFLFVGTIEPRKNIPALVEAWRLIRLRHPVDLVIAGRRRADAPELPFESGVTFTGEVADDQLAGLYSGAIACVYPSLYEGFGLPPLEAMQCGCPVIASRDPAIVEVCGSAAIHVDATDIRSLARSMEWLLTDPGERESRREMGLNRAALFSWERTAVMTREVYAEAIRRFAL